jgi:hypothetical protein
MRAIELRRRLASRSGTSSGAAPVETVPREPLEKVGEAFDRLRAEQVEAQPREEGASGADDPWTHANRAAFLVLEGERRAIAPRLHRAERHRRDRYRDLILITKLTRLEYEHLVGRLGRDVSPSSVPDGPPPPGGDTPAEWARPWGLAPMVELRSTFFLYQRRRDRLAKWLSAPTGASAAASAARHLDSVVGRAEKAMSPYALEVDDGQVSRSKIDKHEPQPPTARSSEAAGTPVKPGAAGRLGFARAATITGALFLAGTGTVVAENQRGGHSAPASALSGSVASALERPLVSLAHNSRGSAPRGGAASHGPRTGKPQHRAQPRLHRGGTQTSSNASEVAPAAPPPAAPAKPALTATTSVPPAAPAPPAPTAAPPAPTPPSNPKPQPTPNPHPGPVSSLPAPVSSLPDPGGRGG